MRSSTWGKGPRGDFIVTFTTSTAAFGAEL